MQSGDNKKCKPTLKGLNRIRKLKNFNPDYYEPNHI
jgi:hypothetical protein